MTLVIPTVHRLWLCKLMQSLILCCSDIINLSVAKIKGGWIKQHPVTK